MGVCFDLQLGLLLYAYDLMSDHNFRCCMLDPELHIFDALLNVWV